MRTTKRFPGVLLAATIAVASTMATALPASAAAPPSCVTQGPVIANFCPGFGFG